MTDRAARAALQQRIHRLRGGTTARPAAWKVALNFAAFQQRLGLTHALAAPIVQLSVHDSGHTLAAGPGRLLHVEAELAIRLATDLDTSSTVEALLSSIESYAPCLELVDYALPRDGLDAMFAHSFFHAGVVLGAAISRDDFAPLPTELPIARDAWGAQHGPVTGTVPADLTVALRGVLARALEADTQLFRGQLVLCGSYIDPIPLPPGARVTVDYGPQLATLEIARSAT
jgi:2-keto-4-pentenoate hydratase